ncbi:hypothetical protein [Streptosporangium canum]|uniref:hypothetical protein n=1 Tax=Streptosporangium canum TaxID=324952 RepID=UPI003F4D2072
MTLGHEAGEVVATGGGTEFAPGDHVVPAFVPACGALPPLRRRTSRALRAGRRGQRERHAARRRAAPHRGRRRTADGPGTIWGCRRSPSTSWCRRARRSGSIPGCPSRSPPCSAAPC